MKVRRDILERCMVERCLLFIQLPVEGRTSMDEEIIDAVAPFGAAHTVVALSVDHRQKEGVLFAATIDKGHLVVLCQRTVDGSLVNVFFVCEQF